MTAPVSPPARDINRTDSCIVLNSVAVVVADPAWNVRTVEIACGLDRRWGQQLLVVSDVRCCERGSKHGDGGERRGDPTSGPHQRAEATLGCTEAADATGSPALAREIGEELLQLPARARLERLAETLVEFVGEQPALDGGPSQTLRGARAVGV